MLVWGCIGFIEHHLINQLVKYNHTIYGCDNLISKFIKRKNKDVEKALLTN